MQLYVQQCKDIDLEKHVPLKPRQYQEEMAVAASSRNTLLVAPTNSGKTKVIGMVLDEMWRKNPCAKVCLSFLPLIEFWCVLESAGCGPNMGVVVV